MLIPKPTADELRVLMAEHGLSVADVSAVACVHTNTVSSWLASRDSQNFRLMPPRHLSAIRAMLPGYLAKRASMERAAAKKKPA